MVPKSDILKATAQGEMRQNHLHQETLGKLEFSQITEISKYFLPPCTVDRGQDKPCG